jgi:SPP1 gp7 family putative phage head morphogenesis protein
VSSPQPAPDEGLTPTEGAVVAALETALLEGALVAGTAVPLYLMMRLTALGLDKRAVRAAARLALSDPLVLPRNLRVRRTATARVAAAEPGIRARYLFNAAKRITANLRLLGTDPHAVMTAVRDERRYLNQHLNAARNRRSSARQVDRVATGSPWLIWKTVMDGRAEPECRALNGELFTVDHPPVVNGRPVYPGAVHPNCRCRAAEFGASPIGAATTVTAPR